MRTAETVLSIIHERGKNGLPLEDVYRQLFNPDLYIKAYARIAKNAGALTEGITNETADGMNLRKIENILEDLRFERFRWTPVRRVYIPKQNGTKRPLGIPTWRDKLLQEVIRSILEAYYEPQFSHDSHGFRPNRGCHTALIFVKRYWKGTKWFIEGDIKGCFDNIEQSILLNTLKERFHDNRFIRLLEGLLKAGYCEDWKFRPTLSGTPQGGIVSPILANIYLDKLDKFIETLLPEYNQGNLRQPNKIYHNLINKVYRLRKQGKTIEAGSLSKEVNAMSLASQEIDDPNYRRLRYIRYADDFLLGFTGTKREAAEIVTRIKEWTAENLKLELSAEKTLITHATKDAAKFLGYEISAQHSTERRTVNGRMRLKIPKTFIKEKCSKYKRKGKVMHRPELMIHSDYEIVTQYQSQLRGYVQYYALAQNCTNLHNLKYVMETSLLKTLARKHKVSLVKVKRRYATTRQTPKGLRKALAVTVSREGKKPLIAYFGGISMSYKKEAVIKDTFRDGLSFIRDRTDLEKRFLAEICEVCGSEDKIEVHHIRKLKDLYGKGAKDRPFWKKVMIAKRRKTLVLCHKCHVNLHAGKPLLKKSGE